MQNQVIKANDNQKLLSIGEASEYLGISIDTLRRWDKKEKITSYRSPGGHRYFKKQDLDKLFGKKYERSEETKPRKINSNLTKDDLSTVIPVIEPSSSNQILEIPKETETEFQIVDRQPREIKIPRIEPVKIIKESSSFVTFEDFQINQTYQTSIQTTISQGILNPTVQNQKVENIDKKKKTKFFLSDNQIAAIIILTTILILSAVVIFTLAKSKPPELLSPI